MKAETPITPEALAEMGFVELNKNILDLEIDGVYLYWYKNLQKISIYGHTTNASTIEDIKELIRLFK